MYLEGLFKRFHHSIRSFILLLSVHIGSPAFFDICALYVYHTYPLSVAGTGVSPDFRVMHPHIHNYIPSVWCTYFR